MQAGDPMIEFNQETKNKGHKELETPRVNVNELNLTENNTEWTVYLGTEVNPREQLEELYNNILVEEVIAITFSNASISFFPCRKAII